MMLSKKAMNNWLPMPVPLIVKYQLLVKAMIQTS